jgi:hypothetical protein
VATLAITPLLTILDSLAKAVQIFAAAVGASGSDVSTVSEGAANNVVTLADAVASSNDVAALVKEFQERATLVTTDALARTLQGERVQVALDAHYGGTGGLNRFLTAQGKRVHPDLRRLGIQVDAVNAFPPAIVTLATFAVTGAATGTLTPGSDVDTGLYGKANTVVRTTTAIGSTTTVTLTMKKLDGTTEQQLVTLPSGTASGVEFDIGTHGTDLYVGVSAIAVAGGTAGNGFAVRTEVERAIAL